MHYKPWMKLPRLRFAEVLLPSASLAAALSMPLKATAQETEFRFKSSVDGKDLVAKIYRPAGLPSPAPFLLVTNSSACFDDPTLADIPRLAADRPFAVVTLDSCLPRSVRSTFTSPGALSFKTQFIDIVDLVNALQTVPDLDTKRWGLTGHSRGGRIALSLSHEKRWNYILGEFPNLKALYPTVAVATAPLCIVPREPKLVVKRLHTIAAEKDDMPPKPCQALAELRASQNPEAKVTFEMLPGANHSFSTDRGIYVSAAFVLKESCFPMYEINRDFIGNESRGVDISEEDVFKNCIARGHYVEGNRALWQSSEIKVLEVVEEAFR